MREPSIHDAAVSIIAGRTAAPGADARRIPVVSAVSQQQIGEVVQADDETVESAIQTARSGFDSWSATSRAERARVLSAAADHVERHGEEIATLVTTQMGMPIALARVSQWHLAASVLRTAADRIDDVAWQQQIEGATLHRSASGVVVAISPWNMPTYQTVAKVAGALAAGCSVVVKPSAQTPYDAERFVTLLHEAGVPSSVLGLVQGGGSVTGSALARHRGVAHVSFTGSVAAGRSVAADAASSLARCTLELGGKSPALVLPGADLDRVIPAIVASGLVNSGQACNATSRLVFPAELRDDIEERLVAAAESLAIGDPFLTDTTIGPLSSESHGHDVTGFARRARDQGGRFLTGDGERAADLGPGYFIRPTIVADLDRTAEAVQEEIFGPVLVTQPYADLDEGLRIANDSRFGLSAEVWGPTPVALEIAPRLRVGQVKVNGVRTRERPGVPFGGRGESGYGRELGAIGIEEFTDLTAVMS